MKHTNRRLEFTVAFRGDDFRARRDTLQSIIDAELQRPDTPFEIGKAETNRTTEEPFKDAATSGSAGAYYKVVMHVKDVFAPFGPSGRAVGAVTAPQTGAPQTGAPQTGAPQTGAPDPAASPLVKQEGK